MELHIPQRKDRFIGWLSMGVFAVLAVMVPFGVLADGGEPWAILSGMLIFLLPGLVIGGRYLYCFPHLRLSADGIAAKTFFRTHRYTWEQFIQAGVLSIVVGKENSGCYVNHLVLLKADGSKRKAHDTWFPIRNLGRLVYLPDTAEVHQWVKRYYGSLDFNLRNGRAEQSFFIEEIPQ